MIKQYVILYIEEFGMISLRKQVHRKTCMARVFALCETADLYVTTHVRIDTNNMFARQLALFWRMRNALIAGMYVRDFLWDRR